MELFAIVLFVSLFCLALTALAFSAATHGDDGDAAADATPARPADSSVPRFFAEPPTPVAPGPPARGVPLETLLLRIEEHVRLEHAAAEAFLERPTAQSLHSRTTSLLVN
jgi:hypothetical protein